MGKCNSFLKHVMFSFFSRIQPFDPSWNTDQGVQPICKALRKTNRICRSESNFPFNVGTSFFLEPCTNSQLCTQRRACSAFGLTLVSGISCTLSISVETRKMVNYARAWWSQVKTWWKLALWGTDVQIVTSWSEYRGERLIEPSSSWFPPKFPSG